MMAIAKLRKVARCDYERSRQRTMSLAFGAPDIPGLFGEAIRDYLCRTREGTLVRGQNAQT